jgi:hypothetical protein
MRAARLYIHYRLSSLLEKLQLLGVGILAALTDHLLPDLDPLTDRQDVAPLDTSHLAVAEVVIAEEVVTIEEVDTIEEAVTAEAQGDRIIITATPRYTSRFT